jgi:hypothetical protein
VNRTTELEVTGNAVSIGRPRAAARLQSRLLEIAAKLHDRIDDALESGERIDPVKASLMLSRCVDAVRKLQPLCEEQREPGSVEELLARTQRLAAAAEELVARERAIDVTPQG